MRSTFSGLFIASCLFVLASCGGKDKKSSDSDSNVTKDTTIAEQTGPNNPPANSAADSTLVPLRSFFEKGLDKWAQSFKGFNTDSFRMTQKTSFGNDEEPADLNNLYALYKAALNFSPDSSQFIDLYSSSVMLEKKGKKIIASGDVDQAILLSDVKTKTSKRIAFFGPSAGIEEAIWASPTVFILAGMFVNDNDEKVPMIMVGDTENKSFRWFESKAVRSKSSKYESSGLSKLKIDEWD